MVAENRKKNPTEIPNSQPTAETLDPQDSDDSSEKSWWQRLKSWTYRNSYYLLGGFSLALFLLWFFYDYDRPGHLDPRRFNPFIAEGEEVTAAKVTKKYVQCDKLFKEIKAYYGENPEVRARKRHPPFDVYLNWPVINAMHAVDFELLEMWNIFRFGTESQLLEWSANWIKQPEDKRHDVARICLNFITRKPSTDADWRALENWDKLVELYQEDLAKDAAGIGKYPEDPEEE